MKLILTIALGFVALSPLPSQAAVLAGPLTNAANGHAYYLLSTNKPTIAEAEAIGLGGQLVTINDAAEQQWVFATFAPLAGAHRMWIGLTDRSAEGAFEWMNGESFTYQHWAPGSPDNDTSGNKDQDYVVMYPTTVANAAGFWDDRDQIETAGIGVYAIAEVRFTQVAPTVVFAEDFESGLTRWTGKTNGPHHGVIVADPVTSGRGQVLTFTSLNGAGDILTATPYSLAGIYTISFDYLGLPTSNSVPGDLGGFFGITASLAGPNTWLAGTHEGFAQPIRAFLADDGTWHRYSISLTNPTLQSFHLDLEDWQGSLGVAGDAFFDNILIATGTINRPAMAIAVQAGHAAIQITGTVGGLYRVEFATEATAANWTAVETFVLPSSPHLFMDTQAINSAARRFYRVAAIQ